MIEKTNLKMIKEQTKLLFDLVSFKKAYHVLDGTGFEGLIISHPFANSAVVMLDDGKLINLYDKKEYQVKYREQTFKRIDRALLPQIKLLINTPYLLLWFKLTKDYMSPQDYAENLVSVWITSENPNMDKNVSLSECIQFFKDADLKYLMDDEEYQFFESLPDEFELYRGVSCGRNPHGISYTTDYNKAKWFQHRFEKENNTGYMITLTVKKEDCICYINSRGEEEIILDTTNYKGKIRYQISKRKKSNDKNHK